MKIRAWEATDMEPRMKHKRAGAADQRQKAGGSVGGGQKAGDSG